jgi:hypothetical protein
MAIVVLTLLFTWLGYGQHSEQPEKESASDLRNQNVLFSVSDLGSKKTYQLERSPNYEYLLRSVSKGEDDVRKISSKDALSLDRQFSSKFLRCQYEIPTAEGPCVATLRLTMKGEDLEICSKDDKKSQEMAPFVQDLSKRF